MVSHFKICDGVYQVGGPNLSNSNDCSIYIVDIGNGEYVLIDCGAGESFDKLIKNISSIGFNPENLNTLILTHGHIDHIGAASQIKNKFGCNIIAHKLDADCIEGHDKVATGASWYGLEYIPIELDNIIQDEFIKLKFGEVEFNIIHTPGHTPGSLAVYCDISDKRILFGQDIHGPFDVSFGSDINAWKKSMNKLLALDADILCEGHFGVFKGKEKVNEYIKSYLDKYKE